MVIVGLLKYEMPREKMIAHGPFTLSNVELLAIILRVGTKNKNVIELSREILNTFDVGLISRKSYSDLLKFNGINKAKATTIIAVFELARRMGNFGIEKNIKFGSSSEIYEFVKSDFNSLGLENVMCVFVDSKNKLIKKEIVFEGSIDYSIIDARIIVKKVLSLDASGFFLIHNHPSGDMTPSLSDIEITKNIKCVCDGLNIRFLDHIIIGDGFYSMFDNDIM